MTAIINMDHGSELDKDIHSPLLFLMATCTARYPHNPKFSDYIYHIKIW